MAKEKLPDDSKKLIVELPDNYVGAVIVRHNGKIIIQCDDVSQLNSTVIISNKGGTTYSDDPAGGDGSSNPGGQPPPPPHP